jgi:8-oxo-dGTP pyrophosphatase MutT (NUDIX family)
MSRFCKGFIILDMDEKTKKIRTPIAFTKQGNGGFLKGKPNPKELDCDTALREKTEESGITDSMIEVLKDVYLDEIKDDDIKKDSANTDKKEKISVRYYIGKYIGDPNHVFVYDQEELSTTKWLTIDEVLAHEKIRPRRKKLLQTAVNMFCSADSSAFISVDIWKSGFAQIKNTYIPIKENKSNKFIKKEPINKAVEKKTPNLNDVNDFPLLV